MIIKQTMKNGRNRHYAGYFHNKNEAKITICSVPDKLGIAIKFFEEFQARGLMWTRLSKALPRDGVSVISLLSLRAI